MTTPIEERLKEIESKPPRICTVPGCVDETRRFGSYCAYHDYKRQKTGDAQGHTIKWKMLKPHYERALFHIEEAERLELEGQPSATWKPIVPVIEGLRHSFEKAAKMKTTRLHRGQGKYQRVAFWLSKMHENELDPRKFMAVITGMALMRESNPDQFVTDLHWWFQTTQRVIRLLPGKLYTGLSKAGTPVPTLGHVKVFASWFLRNRFGMFCGMMAEDIQAKMNEEEDMRVGPMADVV